MASEPVQKECPTVNEGMGLHGSRAQQQLAGSLPPSGQHVAAAKPAALDNGCVACQAIHSDEAHLRRLAFEARVVGSSVTSLADKGVERTLVARSTVTYFRLPCRPLRRELDVISLSKDKYIIT